MNGLPALPRDDASADTRLVPFLARVDDALHARWIDELRIAFADELARRARSATPSGTPIRIELVRFADLSDVERAGVRVAIVADADPAELAALPALEWVQSLWAGVETLVDAFRERDVGIARLVDPRLAEAMAEAVLAWTLYLHRDMPRYLAQQRAGIWADHELVPAGARRVGVLGLGALGERAARTLVGAGFDVAGWSRSAKSLDGVRTFHGDDGLAALLERSDVLVVVLPLTDATRGLVDADALARLPPDASLVNVARGPIVVETDLLAALDDGRLAHAVLDVFEVEPLPPAHPYWSHPGVTVMPHVAAPTDRPSASRVAARAIVTWAASGERPETVDPRRGY